MSMLNPLLKSEALAESPASSCHDWIAQRQYERRAYEIVELERLRVDSVNRPDHRPGAILAAAKEPHPSSKCM